MERLEFHRLFIRRWMLIALSFFFLSAVAGLIMRYFFIGEITILKYKYVLHAHSHTALLGWGYLFLTGALLFYFLKTVARPRLYERLFYALSITILGMYVSFLYQGYGLWSISISAVFILLSFWMSFLLLGEFSKISGTAAVFARWSIVWYITSTIGVWAIGPISQLLGRLHPAYFASVQFFLHFQFNGWFTYGVLALLYHFMGKISGKEPAVSKLDFILLQFSVLSTYALSITWSTPLNVLFYLNALGVVIQLYVMIRILKPALSHVWQKGMSLNLGYLLLAFGVLSILIKTMVQFLVAFPVIAVISYTIRQYVIGFVHLIMLGSFTFLVGGILLKSGILSNNAVSKWGWTLLLGGFIGSELMLFGQGTLLWMHAGMMTGYHEILFCISTLLPTGIALLFLGNAIRNDQKSPIISN